MNWTSKLSLQVVSSAHDLLSNCVEWAYPTPAITMKKYQAYIRVKGHHINTAVYADSPLHARLILEYQFGMNCVVRGPDLIKESDTLKPIKPLPPEQHRLASMRQQKDRLTKDIKAERDRQKLKKAQQQIFKLAR